ncbi:MAG TPA: anthranilate phosphoribosyltransferase, partial [Acidimicrobiia bacterium]|nr:anthranilate phosphoribosyltransferase [Acidimicrobiia bacterium]
VAHGSGGLTDTGGVGLDEISILGPTSIAEVKGDSVEHYTITPEDFGLKRATSIDDLMGGDPAYNAGVIRDIFEGRDQGPRRDFLALNNAFALYVAGVAKSPEEGLRLAQENIDSGAASRKLAEFVEASQAIAPTGG